MKEKTSVKVANYGSYTEEANSFAKIFQHFSTDEPSPGRGDYVLNWLQRYFVLKQYMIENKLSRAFHPDSDSMILRYSVIML